MITVDQLRIGNYVSFRERYWAGNSTQTRDIDVAIFEIFADKVRTNLDNKVTSIKNIYPISLTEEKLILFGFKKLENFPSTFLIEIETYSMSPIIKLYAYLDENGITSCIRLIQGNNSMGNMLQVNALHQLQNLYYTLFGIERNITL